MDADVLRILDANYNRAREALRVIEDYARFVLDDADAATAAKQQRHALQEFTNTFGPAALLGARDIANDVGRDTKTPSELQRQVPADIVHAAFGRLTEAARTLGEYAKLTSPDAAAIAETLRYSAYELEQRLVLRGTRRARFRNVRLYVLITATLCQRDWLEVAAAVLRGGAGCLQLREKELPDAELLNRARQLRELTTRHEALLAINDRPDIARLAGADIVHVGQQDLSVKNARRIAGTSILVGKSTHTLEQFEAARAEEPDYLAVGPMFQSPTKPQDHIAGPQTLAQAASRTQIPLVAIGGITADNVAPIMSAGASCICACSAVVSTADPEAAARTLSAAIEDYHA
ncbi:MAG: thiamine phosphate synthase [Planctomycetota bacterium]